ncbi:thioredoxin fold domain-containing protein [Candidatus Neomarinimicrobiota bacterium]
MTIIKHLGIAYLAIIMIILAVLSACSSASREGRLVKFTYEDKTFDEIVAMVNASDKTGLLYFTFEGCGPCKALQDSVFHNEQAIEYIEASFTPFWIEWGESAVSNALQKRFQVRGFPTIILISGSGEMLNQVGGYGGTAEAWVERLKAAADPANSLSALAAAGADNPDDLEAALKYAEGLMYARKMNEAIEHYEQLKEEIAAPEIYYNLSFCYQLKDTEKMIVALEEGLALNLFDDKIDMIHCRLGNILANRDTDPSLRNYTKALEYYEKLPESASDFKSYGESENQQIWIDRLFQIARHNLRYVYIATGQEEKGRAMHHELFSRLYEEKDARGMGSVMYSCYRYEMYMEEALPWGEKANELVEWKEISPLRHYARLLQKTGHYERAIEVQEILIEVIGEESRNMEDELRLLAVMHLQAGHETKATAMFDKLVTDAGNDFYKYWYLAFECLQNEVNYQQALGWAEKAIELSKTEYALESENANWLDLFPGMFPDTYAELLFRTGQIPKAIEVSTEAIEVALEEDDKRPIRSHRDGYIAAMN